MTSDRMHATVSNGLPCVCLQIMLVFVIRMNHVFPFWYLLVQEVINHICSQSTFRNRDNAALSSMYSIDVGDTRICFGDCAQNCSQNDYEILAIFNAVNVPVVYNFLKNSKWGNCFKITGTCLIRPIILIIWYWRFPQWHLYHVQYLQ